MKTQQLFEEAERLSRETARVAPLVRESLAACGAPSPRVERVIRREARRTAARHRARRWWRPRVALAAVAGLLVLLGGVVSLTVRQPPGARAQRAARQEARPPVSDPHQEEPGFARVLLNLQGLDEEGFFNEGAEEALWL